MLTTIVFALLLPASDPALTYAAPSRGAKPADFKLTAWKKGDRVFIGTDLVNLRAKSSAKAAIVTQLDLGTRVTVLAVGPRERVGKAVNHWYEVEAKTARGVRRGHLFGTTLSPFLVEADLDEDGVKEKVSVGWTEGFAARLRVLEPQAFGSRREAKGRFTPGGTWKGGTVTKLSIVDKKTAGMPLVELEVLIDDPDDSYKTYWRTFYAYHPPEDRGRGPGTLVEQLSTYKNNEVSSVVTFDPDKREASVRFVVDGKKKASGDTYPLKAAPPAPDYGCTLDPDELSGGPKGAKGTRDGNHLVYTRELAGNVRLQYTHGGCEHYAQVWIFEGVRAKPTLKARAQQAIALLTESGGQNAEQMASTLRAALPSLSDDANGGVPCGDATCSVTVAGGGDRETLVVSYDFAI